MTVYHGGAIAVPNPDLSHSRKAVDFGAGFYVTPILNQAVRWGEKRKRRYGSAVISKYEYDEVSASALKILRFDGYSEDWLDFIISCRSGKDKSDYDIVIGGIANDRVFNTIELYLSKLATKEETINRLKYEKPNLQINFRTQMIIDGYLRYEGCERL